MFSGDSCCYEFGAAGLGKYIQHIIPNIYVKMVAFGDTPGKVSIIVSYNHKQNY